MLFINFTKCVIFIVGVQFFASYNEIEQTQLSNLLNTDTVQHMVRDTGDVIYITQASPGIIESGSLSHPYTTLEEALDDAENGDDVVFLRGYLNNYEISSPLLLSKNILIRVEIDSRWRSGDDEPFLPKKDIPLIIN